MTHRIAPLSPRGSRPDPPSRSTGELEQPATPRSPTSSAYSSSESDVPIPAVLEDQEIWAQFIAAIVFIALAFCVCLVCSFLVLIILTIYF
jgi:hypothetical protein